ncbi:hypothetical protein BDV25DRAFT_154540 [Aspergillus avenaceus]|uniref:DUF167 domain protein n=1 Tax=Aspergillus avenaceus TaxID=36643 RepID=A0A5N6TWG3_ASPAV|nr:hypothetical protein BDV25DRAFT_154540 [Aspergillus avenaceus]
MSNATQFLRLVQNATKPRTKPPQTYNLQIACNVKPNASGNREGIIAIGPEKVDVCVAAVPRNGEANTAVSRLFAQVLRVPKSTIDVVKGLKSRDKTLCVYGVEIGSEGEEGFLQGVRGKLENAMIRK